MHRYLLNILFCLLSIAEIALSSETPIPAELSGDEETLWNLERAYWRYVENNDLAAYSGLWHQNFLGWPSISAVPVDKDHITDWITSQTSQGLVFKSVAFKPAAIQVTGDVASVCYWITVRWLDKEGNGAPHTLRITHTWLKTEENWRIIGGMSMPEQETAR
jgi:ketosteroid isomerase-like protein